MLNSGVRNSWDTLLMKRLLAALSSTSRLRSCNVTVTPFRALLLGSVTATSTMRKVRVGEPKLQRMSRVACSPANTCCSASPTSIRRDSGSRFTSGSPTSLRASQRNNRWDVGLASTTQPRSSRSMAPSAMVAMRDCCWAWATLSSLLATFISSMLAALYTSSWLAMVLNPSSSSPSSPPMGSAIRVENWPAVILRTPWSSALMGWVMVRALKTAPKITSTQMAINTAMVTLRVKAVVLRTTSLGLRPRATTPRRCPLAVKGTNTSVTCPSGDRC